MKKRRNPEHLLTVLFLGILFFYLYLLSVIPFARQWKMPVKEVGRFQTHAADGKAESATGNLPCFDALSRAVAVLWRTFPSAGDFLNASAKAKARSFFPSTRSCPLRSFAYRPIGVLFARRGGNTPRADRGKGQNGKKLPSKDLFTRNKTEFPRSRCGNSVLVVV